MKISIILLLLLFLTSCGALEQGNRHEIRPHEDVTVFIFNKETNEMTHVFTNVTSYRTYTFSNKMSFCGTIEDEFRCKSVSQETKNIMFEIENRSS